jgi:RNA polymerase subunit RPABC4/transcription elongation factor Spt4
VTESGGDILSDINEQLVAIKGERAALEEKQLQAFAGFGKLALPELKDKPAFAESAAELEAIETEIKALGEREAGLLAEQEKLEREEKERIARFTCVTCKTVNPEDAKFCENCGTPVGELPREYCQACATLNHPGLKFCGECGAKLSD